MAWQLSNLPVSGLFTLANNPEILLRRSDDNGVNIRCQVVAVLKNEGFVAVDNEPWIPYNRYTTVVPLLPMIPELV